MPSVANKQAVENLIKEFEASEHVIITEYKGCTTIEINELRQLLQPFGSTYRVVKNRLAKIAAKKAGWDGLDQHFVGPSAIAYKGTDGPGIIKTIKKFSDKNKKMKLKAGHMFGRVIELDEIRSLADLPTREVLISTLLARLNSPLQTLVVTLNEPLRGLHAALSGLATKKESAKAA